MSVTVMPTWRDISSSAGANEHNVLDNSLDRSSNAILGQNTKTEQSKLITLLAEEVNWRQHGSRATAVTPQKQNAIGCVRIGASYYIAVIRTEPAGRGQLAIALLPTHQFSKEEFGTTRVYSSIRCRPHKAEGVRQRRS